MSHVIVLLMLCFVPRESMAVEYCGHLALNHVVTVQEDSWGGDPWLQTTSCWLGWRRGVADETSMIDWRKGFDGEEVWYDGARRYMILWDWFSHRRVLVIAESFAHHWTEYDIELDQRSDFYRRNGVEYSRYQRGLARTQPH